MTDDEKKKWKTLFIKYLQIKNNTGRSKLPENVFNEIDEWYNKYLVLMEDKIRIISLI